MTRLDATTPVEPPTGQMWNFHDSYVENTLGVLELIPDNATIMESGEAMLGIAFAPAISRFVERPRQLRRLSKQIVRQYLRERADVAKAAALAARINLPAAPSSPLPSSITRVKKDPI